MSISVSLYHTTGAPGRDLAGTVPVMQEDTSTKKTQLTTPSHTEVSHVPKSGEYIIVHNSICTLLILNIRHLYESNSQIKIITGYSSILYIYRDCYGILYSPHTLGNSVLTFTFKSF